MEKISTIDSNHIIDLLAAGNIPMWIMTVLLFICLFIITWIKFEPSVRNLFFFFKDFFSREEKLEREKEKDSSAIKTTLFFDKISSLFVKIDMVVLSKDIGRNAFYHFILNEAFSCLYKQFKEGYENLQKEKIAQNMFCSFSKYHSNLIQKAREDFESRVTKRLKEEGWSEEKIRYTLDIFVQWLSPNINFLSELISSSKIPTEVVMSWWIFYYEIFMNLERFGIMLNGRITGQYFDKLKIGKPVK